MSADINSDIKNWSTTASYNPPSGTTPTSNLDENLRQIQATVRSAFENAPWFNYGHSYAYGDADTFTISTPNTDLTSIYHAGRRVKVVVTAGTYYGVIVSSSFSTGTTTVNITLDSGALDAGLSAVWVGPPVTGKPIGYYRLIDVQVFTSSGTWTKPTGCTAVLVEGVGGGGAGGGTQATGAGQVSVGGGGGGGGYFRKWITSGLGATETVTVGAGGTGGVGTNGSGGGTSSFGAHASATGGSGGAAGTAGSLSTSAGASGGSGSGGDININGQQGGDGWGEYGHIVQVGYGGSSMLAPAQRGQTGTGNGQGVGLNGKSYGGGGSGAFNIGTNGAGAGAPGAAGIVIVYSYA